MLILKALIRLPEATVIAPVNGSTCSHVALGACNHQTSQVGASGKALDLAQVSHQPDDDDSAEAWETLL